MGPNQAFALTKETVRKKQETAYIMGENDCG